MHTGGKRNVFKHTVKAQKIWWIFPPTLAKWISPPYLLYLTAPVEKSGKEASSFLTPNIFKKPLLNSRRGRLKNLAFLLTFLPCPLPPKKNRLPPPHIHFPLYCSCVRRSRGEKRKENYLGKISWAEKRRRKGTNLVHSVSMPPPPPPPPPKAPQSTFKSSDGMGWEEVGSRLGRVRINSDFSYFFTCGETVRS